MSWHYKAYCLYNLKSKHFKCFSWREALFSSQKKKKEKRKKVLKQTLFAMSVTPKGKLLHVLVWPVCDELRTTHSVSAFSSRLHCSSPSVSIEGPRVIDSCTSLNEGLVTTLAGTVAFYAPCLDALEKNKGSDMWASEGWEGSQQECCTVNILDSKSFMQKTREEARRVSDLDGVPIFCSRSLAKAKM